MGRATAALVDPQKDPKPQKANGRAALASRLSHSVISHPKLKT